MSLLTTVFVAAGCNGSSIELRGVDEQLAGASLAKHTEEDDHDALDDQSGDVEGATKDEDLNPDEHGDEPSWINGSYLTCAWVGAESAAEVAVECQIDGRDGKSIPPSAANGVAFEWQAERSSGDVEPAPQAPTGSTTAIERRFVLAASIVADLTIAVILTTGDGPAATGATLAVRTTTLESQLPGLGLGEETRNCLERGDPAPLCLSQSATIAAAKRFFVTSQTFTGDLGSISGADAKCAAAATSAALGGAWIAVISTASSTIADRVTRGVPVVDLNEAPLANEAQSLLGGGPRMPLGLDETGAVVSAASVWTGTLTGGQASDQDCSGWTSAFGSGTTGTFGGGAALGEWLVSTLGDDCAKPARLYCIEL